MRASAHPASAPRCIPACPDFCSGSTERRDPTACFALFCCRSAFSLLTWQRSVPPPVARQRAAARHSCPASTCVSTRVGGCSRTAIMKPAGRKGEQHASAAAALPQPSRARLPVVPPTMQQRRQKTTTEHVPPHACCPAVMQEAVEVGIESLVGRPLLYRAHASAADPATAGRGKGRAGRQPGESQWSRATACPPCGPSPPAHVSGQRVRSAVLKSSLPAACRPPCSGYPLPAPPPLRPRHPLPLRNGCAHAAAPPPPPMPLAPRSPPTHAHHPLPQSHIVACTLLIVACTPLKLG